MLFVKRIYNEMTIIKALIGRVDVYLLIYLFIYLFFKSGKDMQKCVVVYALKCLCVYLHSLCMVHVTYSMLLLVYIHMCMELYFDLHSAYYSKL